MPMELNRTSTMCENGIFDCMYDFTIKFINVVIKKKHSCYHILYKYGECKNVSSSIEFWTVYVRQ